MVPLILLMMLPYTEGWYLHLRSVKHTVCRQAPSLMHKTTTHLIEHFLQNPLQAQIHFQMCNYRQLLRSLWVCLCFQRHHRRSIVNQQSTRGLKDQPIDSLPGKSIQSKALLKLDWDQKVEDIQQERPRARRTWHKWVWTWSLVGPVWY